MSSIKFQCEFVKLLATVGDAANRLKALQSTQQHVELKELSGKYDNSARYSKLQAITTLFMSVAVIGIFTALGAGYGKSAMGTICTTIGKTGGEVGRSASEILFASPKTRTDGSITILNTKISSQQSQGASSAKTTEEEMMRTLSTITQMFQKSIAAPAA